MRSVGVVRIYLALIAEQVSILVHMSRFMVVKADGVYPQGRKCVQFVCLANTVVVGINPQPQGRKNSIPRINV
jgi:hypothetical protein